jgi:hypothetical protein
MIAEQKTTSGVERSDKTRQQEQRRGPTRPSRKL